MNTLLRRMRGAIGMGLTWGAAWFFVGGIPRWVMGIETDLPFPLLFFGLGVIGGVTFSAILAFTDGRRRLDQLSLPRFAMWGALGGVAISALFVAGVSYGWGTILALGATFAAAGAVSASGSLAIARRAAALEITDGGDSPRLHE